MYDINVYQYETKPFNCSGKYGILPLNEKGLHKYYLGKNTHTRYYLNKFNPIILHDEKEEDAKKTVTLEPIIKENKANYAMNVSKSTPSLNVNKKRVKSRYKTVMNDIKEKFLYSLAVYHLKNEDVESRFKAVNFVKRKVKSAKTKINSRMDKVNSVLTNATDTVMNLGYDAVYMEENPFKSVANRNQNTPIVNSTITEDTPVSGSSVKSKPRFTSPAVKMAKGKASTFLTKNKGNVTTEELRSLESIEKINDKSYDKYADQSETENNDDQRVMSKALDTLNKTDLEELSHYEKPPI